MSVLSQHSIKTKIGNAFEILFWICAIGYALALAMIIAVFVIPAPFWMISLGEFNNSLLWLICPLYWFWLVGGVLSYIKYDKDIGFIRDIDVVMNIVAFAGSWLMWNYLRKRKLRLS